jgi:hypothetical protein
VSARLQELRDARFGRVWIGEEGKIHAQRPEKWQERSPTPAAAGGARRAATGERVSSALDSPHPASMRTDPSPVDSCCASGSTQSGRACAAWRN